MKGLGVLIRTLGDCVLINVLARNIKLMYPDMELFWALEEKYREIVDFNPDIESRKIVLQDTAKDWDALLTEAVFYDKVFMFQQLRPEDGTWHQKDETRFQNLVDFYASRGNIELVDRKLYWHFDPECQVPVLKEGAKVFIHTTTLGAAKNWDRFGALVKEFQSNGILVYQIGLSSDISVGVESEYDLRSKFSLQQVAKLLKDNCSCFVGLDSGLSFMAAAVGIPTVVIYGASIPLTSGPWGSNVISIEPESKPSECMIKPCHALWNSCVKGSKCINSISVDTVLKVVSEILV